MFVVLLVIYIGLGLLGHVARPFLTFWGIVRLFHTGYTILLSHQQSTRVLVSPCPHQYLLFSVFFYNGCSNEYKVYLTVLLISSSLIINVLSMFSCAYWVVLCLWRNTCSGPFAHSWACILVLSFINSYIFWIWIPYQRHNLQIFPILLVTFLLISVLWCVEF